VLDRVPLPEEGVLVMLRDAEDEPPG
jgi:hypothetical protein